MTKATRIGQPYLYLVLLLAVTALIYAQGAGGPFLLDDYANILNNKALDIERPDWQAVQAAAWSGHAGPLQRPVAMASFALDMAIAGGPDAVWFKGTNILLHLATGLLLFFLARALARQYAAVTAPGAAAGAVSPDRAALLVAGLWLIHPLHVSTVLYVVQRMTILAALFAVAAMLCYVGGRRWLVAGRTWRGLALAAGGTIAFGILSIYSKENGALLVVMLLAVEAAFFRFDFGPRAPAWVRPLAAAGLALPSLAILGYLGLSAAASAGHDPQAGFVWWERLLTQARVLFFYLSEIVYPDPFRMSLYHYGAFPPSEGWWQPATALPAALTWLVAMGLAVYGLVRRRWVLPAFGLLWFLAGHLLESTVLSLELVFEHRNYLPAFGILFAAGLGVDRLSAGLARPAVTVLVMAALVAGGANLLAYRVESWSGLSRFLVSELSSHPESPRVWGVLAYSLAKRGRFHEAIRFYEKAAELDPAELGHRIGAVSLKVNQLGEPPTAQALAALLARLREQELSAHTRNQLFTLGRSALGHEPPSAVALRAAEQVLAAAVRNPHWHQPERRAALYFYLGQIRFYLDRRDAAVRALQRGLALDGGADSARIRLAILLLEAGDIDAAARHAARVDAAGLPAPERALYRDLRRALAARTGQKKGR